MRPSTQPHYFANVCLPLPLTSTSLGCPPQKICHRRVAQRIARSRIVQKHRVEDVAEDGSNAFYRRQDLLGSHNSYNSCTFLDPHGTVALACDTAGRLDVVRLPDYGQRCSGAVGKPMGTLLAGKLSIRQSDDLNGGGFHLKSIDRGNSFCVGMPNGQFSIFATERSTDLGYRYGLSQNATNFYQEMPRDYSTIKSAWMISLHALTQRQYRIHRASPTSVNSSYSNGNTSTFFGLGGQYYGQDNVSLEEAFSLDQKRTFYDNRYRWAFLENSSSAILAAHVDVDCHGVTLKGMDSRLSQESPRSAFHLEQAGRRCTTSMTNEDASSVCWISDNFLLTSHEQTEGSTIKLWDIRMSSVVADHPISPHHSSESCERPKTSLKKDDPQRKPRVLRLTPSLDGTGTVLATIENERIHSKPSYEHRLIDVGTWNIINVIKRPSAPSADGLLDTTSAMPLVDAVTPYLDCYASYELPFIEFSDLSANGDALPKPQKCSTFRGVKRRCGGGERISNESRFTPKLFDGNSLSTRLTCLAFDESGTSLIGGSLDGDLFVWRGG